MNGEPPRLVLICGLPAAGKTMLAKRVAASLGAVRLCPDRWLADLGFDGHDENARTRVESLQWQLAQELLSLRQSVVLEWGFWSKSQRDRLRDRARELGAAVELRFLDVDLDELWRRLEARNAHLPDATYLVTRDQLSLYSSWLERPAAEEFSLFDPPVGYVEDPTGAR